MATAVQTDISPPHFVNRIRGPIHPTILLMACVHMMVDGYGNIFAPLLPLLIPRLNLSLVFQQRVRGRT